MEVVFYILAGIFYTLLVALIAIKLYSTKHRVKPDGYLFVTDHDGERVAGLRLSDGTSRKVTEMHGKCICIKILQVREVDNE